jgi:hypothetical protein
MKKNSSIDKKKIAHLLSGVTVVLHGVADLEVANGHPWFYFLLGSLMIVLAFTHHQIEKFSNLLANSFYFFEAAVLLFICIHYFEIGKKYLPYPYLFSSIAYVIIGIKLIKKEK